MDPRTVRAIAAVISSEAGHSVEIFGQRVYRLEDGKYAFCDSDVGQEVVFKSAIKAAKYFEKMRGSKRRDFDDDEDFEERE